LGFLLPRAKNNNNNNKALKYNNNDKHIYTAITKGYYYYYLSPLLFRTYSDTDSYLDHYVVYLLQ